ncbi:type II toxin-antitoxin system RelE/ParE family toxin [Acidisoma cladoniae]|uniref:type II toxin-antitoxin system RelE/ParE family toxin n=1 Tax=Acidisoma cladoniae TaxID=3040935 RepID=UPI0033131F6B
MEVVFTPLAERHIDTLHQYISPQANSARADAFVQSIVAFCIGLSTFPKRGMPRNDLLIGLRTTVFAQSVTIAFTVSVGVVLIEGVHYGGQDLELMYRTGQ